MEPVNCACSFLGTGPIVGHWKLYTAMSKTSGDALFQSHIYGSVHAASCDKLFALAYNQWICWFRLTCQSRCFCILKAMYVTLRCDYARGSLRHLSGTYEINFVWRKVCIGQILFGQFSCNSLARDAGNNVHFMTYYMWCERGLALWICTLPGITYILCIRWLIL